MDTSRRVLYDILATQIHQAVHNATSRLAHAIRPPAPPTQSAVRHPQPKSPTGPSSSVASPTEVLAHSHEPHQPFQLTEEPPPNRALVTATPT